MIKKTAVYDTGRRRSSKNPLGKFLKVGLQQAFCQIQGVPAGVAQRASSWRALDVRHLQICVLQRFVQINLSRAKHEKLGKAKAPIGFGDRLGLLVRISADTEHATSFYRYIWTVVTMIVGAPALEI